MRGKCGIFLSVAFVLWVGSSKTLLAQTEVGGDVSGIWKIADSPFIVKDDIAVPEDDTLTIEPGVNVLFNGHYRFTIRGLLNAVGTEVDTIIFTHREADSTWAGIRFSEANENSVLEYCRVEYSDQTGIFISKSSITIKHNTIRNNQDLGSQFQAGMGGGIYIAFSAPLIAENLIVNNSAERGGGIEYNEGGVPGTCKILNNIIVGNSATWGGGIRIFGAGFGSAILIRNNVLDNNSADFGGNIYVFSGANPEIVNNVIINSPNGSGIFNLGNADIRYNNVWNNQPFDYELTNPGIGDISADPLFVGGTPIDYHLQESSPCIDAGDPDSPLDPDNTVSDIGAFFFGEDLPPIPVTGFQALPSDQKVLLQWQIPNLIDYSATRLVRRTDRFPMNQDDGDVIFEGNTLLFQDTGLQNGAEYFYAAFAKDAARQFSEASFANAVPEAGTSAVIRIPVDFVTIQEGLNAASPGDTVMVYPGTYSPSTNGEVFPIMMADSVVLISKSGRDSTVVDAEQTNLVFLGANDATIRGFTITGGWNSSIGADTLGGFYGSPSGGGILCRDATDMEISENAIIGNRADGPLFPDGRGGGIFCFDSEVIIKDNIITDNFADREHGGISCVGGSAVIENNQILRNKGGGIGLTSILATIRKNLIAENVVTGLGIPIPGGIDLGPGSVEIINNTIAFNYNSQFPANISAIYIRSGGNNEIKSNIVWGHDDQGEEIAVGVSSLLNSIAISYCNIEGSFPGEGNRILNFLLDSPLIIT